MESATIDRFEIWGLAEALTVAQAALLIIGVDPDGVQYSIQHANHRPAGLEPVMTALAVAINTGKLRATDNGSGRRDENHKWQLPVVGDFDWPHRVTVLVSDIKEWLRQRDYRSTFFLPDQTSVDHSSIPPYMNPHHEHRAPKLVAAIRAWEAVTNKPGLLKHKSAKAAITKWLKEHASEFALVKADGSPNELGIEEVAKVANWSPKGGAPKTE
ncbi:hypothetical protein [Occallatibacter savannae]|uniref:hypothetical protein n=1 Tax=Occallatibacter savannae TaxID=1002691 RepID=UPI000D6991E2|nr:hypothetical protein [Occallatibacter savannae]